MNKLFSNFSKKGRETSKGKPKAKKVFVPSLPARPPTEVELLVSKLGTDRAALVTEKRVIDKEMAEVSKDLKACVETLEESKTALQTVQQSLLEEAGEVQALLQSVANKENAVRALHRNEALAREALRASQKDLAELRAAKIADLKDIMKEARDLIEAED